MITNQIISICFARFFICLHCTHMRRKKLSIGQTTSEYGQKFFRISHRIVFGAVLVLFIMSTNHVKLLRLENGFFLRIHFDRCRCRCHSLLRNCSFFTFRIVAVKTCNWICVKHLNQITNDYILSKCHLNYGSICTASNIPDNLKSHKYILNIRGGVRSHLKVKIC